MTRDDLKEKAKAAGDAAKRFNTAPPVWFYIVAGVLIVLAFQVLRHL